MCLETISNLKIAKKDLYTIKIASGIRINSSRSRFRNTLQRYGKLHTANLNKNVPLHGQVYVGLHSLKACVHNTNHLIYGISDYNLHSRGFILCKIPKGAEYYIGNDGDIVSNQLILIEPLVVNSRTTIKLEVHMGDMCSVNKPFIEAVRILNSYYGKQKY